MMTSPAPHDPASRTGAGADATSFFLKFFLCWTAFAFLSRYPGYIHFDTAEIYAWSTLGFEPGFEKHPPLMPWMVTALSAVFPENWITLVLLGVVNVTLAAYLVWRLAEMTLGRGRAPLAIALYMLSVYTVWHGLKFNHNSILLTLWPLTAIVFLDTLKNPTWSRGVLLGIVCALGMYAKYSSALLFVGLFTASLVSSYRGSFYRSSAPYVAGLVFVALMAPHVNWEYQNHFQTFRNANNAMAEVGALPKRLLAENFSRSIPIFVVFYLFLRWIGRAKPNDSQFPREMLAIALIPLFLTIAMTIGLGLRGSHSWTTPIYCFVPIVLAAFVRTPAPEQLRVLGRVFDVVFLVMPVVGAAMTGYYFYKGVDKATEPIPELARAAAGIWHSTIGTPVAIFGGEHHFAVGASLALDEHPRSWSNFVGHRWVPESLLDEKGAVSICSEAMPSCSELAERLASSRNGWSCELALSRTLVGYAGKTHKVRVYIMPPKGFAKEIPPEARCKGEGP